MTGYQEYFARRDAAEARRIKEAVAATAGVRPEPERQRTPWYLVLAEAAFWVASMPWLIVSFLSLATLVGAAMLVGWWLVFQVATRWGRNGGLDFGPGVPTQTQLLIEQNRLIREGLKRG